MTTKNEILYLAESQAWKECQPYIQRYILQKKSSEEAKHFAKCEKKAREKFLTTLILHNYVSNFSQDGSMPHGSVQRSIEEQKDNICTKSVLCMLTVNPKPGITLEQFTKVVDKFVKKIWIAEYFYVYEIRKAPDQGLHSHILYRYTCRPRDMKNSCKKYFADICDTNNSSILNFRYIDPTLALDKINYMLGNKQQKKQSGVRATLAYRTNNNLESYYESNPPLTCRVTTKLQITTNICGGNEGGRSTEGAEPSSHRDDDWRST